MKRQAIRKACRPIDRKRVPRAIVRSIRFSVTFALGILLTYTDASVAEEGSTGQVQDSGLSLLDALRMTLVLNPQLQIQQESVRIARGARQEQRGQFDLIKSADLHGNQLYDDTLRIRNSGFRTQLARTSRNGSTYGVQADVLRIKDEVTHFNRPTTGTVTFFVDHPLLRGRGIGTSAAEKAAVHELYAERYELNQVIANQVATTASDYWDYVSAASRSKVIELREQRAQERIREVRRLVEKGEQPRSVIALATADLVNVRAERTTVQAEFYNAKQTLGISIGTDYTAIDTLSQPADSFPRIGARELRAPSDDAWLSDLILSQRGELLAAQRRMEAAHVLWHASQQNAKPLLNLNMNVGYTNIEYGSGVGPYLGSLVARPPGANAGMALSYQAPHENNQRRGQLTQSLAIYRQHRIAVANLRRTILSEVSVAINTLQGSANAFDQRTFAVQQYQQALNDIRRKYQLGMATLLDVLQVENEYTDALLSQVDAATLAAKSLVELHRVCGTIVGPCARRVELDAATLVTIPEIFFP